MQKVVIIIGAVILLVGLFWPWLERLPIGRLPGDIVVDKPEFKFFLPLTILLSLFLSLLFWLFRR